MATAKQAELLREAHRRCRVIGVQGVKYQRCVQVNVQRLNKSAGLSGAGRRRKKRRR